MPAGERHASMQSFQIMLKSTSMSERAYYEDSYKTRFKANVLERLVHDGRPAVVLDHTYFYPTSGGQPCDLGQINDVSVVDVLVRPGNGDVLHVLDNDLDEEQVTAVINWQRRFDHMQHHTGQHILSQAFIQIATAQTIGFHLSESSVTIDLDISSLTPAQIEEVEQLTNEIIWQNRPVKVRTVNAQEVQSLPLRKIPPVRDGKLRLIEIAEFDLTACGGTHVAQSGEVGLLKIIKQERRGEKQRIEFRCGHRAFIDYRQKHQIVTQLSTQLTTAAKELSPAVARLQEDNKQSRRQLKKQQVELDRLEAQQLLSQGERHGDTILVTHLFSGRDPGQVRALGSQLARNEGVVALLAMAGNRSQLIFCRSENAPGKMNKLLRIALNELGSQSGGGSDTFAQGVGPPADVAAVQHAVDTATTVFLEELESLR